MLFSLHSRNVVILWNLIKLWCLVRALHLIFSSFRYSRTSISFKNILHLIFVRFLLLYYLNINLYLNFNDLVHVTDLTLLNILFIIPIRFHYLNCGKNSFRCISNSINQYWNNNAFCIWTLVMFPKTHENTKIIFV